jgi:hypothetical protein
VNRYVVIVLGLCLMTGIARADDTKPELQKMRFVERNDVLTVSGTALTKLFDNAAYDALDDGPASTVIIRIWIYPQGSNSPVGGAALQRQVSYEPWDEIFYLNIDGKKFKEKRKADALRRLTAFDDIVVARLASLPYDQVFLLAMQVELNPVSKETLAEVNRWLSQGTGGLDRGGAFFGSFVSVFVNPKFPEADRVLRLQSQPFFRPKP